MRLSISSSPLREHSNTLSHYDLEVITKCSILYNEYQGCMCASVLYITEYGSPAESTTHTDVLWVLGVYTFSTLDVLQTSQLSSIHGSLNTTVPSRISNSSTDNSTFSADIQHCTFLHFVAEQKDFIPSFAATRVAVDSADLQLSCVWGPCEREKASMSK